MEVSDTSTALSSSCRPLVDSVATFKGEVGGPVYVGSPTFIPAIDTSIQIEQIEGRGNGIHGDAVETATQIQRSSSADFLTEDSVNSSFSFCTAQEPPAPVISPSTGGKKWKDDGIPCLRKVSHISSSSVMS
jgi:hypothetical protein